jgi:hypothetical protein
LNALYHWQKEHPHKIGYAKEMMQVNLIDSSENESIFRINRNTEMSAIKRKYMNDKQISDKHFKNIHFEFENRDLFDLDTARDLQLPIQTKITVTIRDELNETNFTVNNDQEYFDNSEIINLSKSFSTMDASNYSFNDSMYNHNQLDFPKPFLSVNCQAVRCNICNIEYNSSNSFHNNHNSAINHTTSKHSNFERANYQISESKDYLNHFDVVKKLNNMDSINQDDLVLFYEKLFKQAKKYLFDNQNQNADKYLDLCIKLSSKINSHQFANEIHEREIYLIKVTALTKIKNYPAAQNLCDSILKLDMFDKDAQLRRALIFKLQENIKSMIKDLQAIQIFEPNNIFAKNELKRLTMQDDYEHMDLSCLYNNNNLSEKEIFCHGNTNIFENFKMNTIFLSKSINYNSKIPLIEQCRFPTCHNVNNVKRNSALFKIHFEICHADNSSNEPRFICPNFEKCGVSIRKDLVDMGSEALLLHIRYNLNQHHDDEIVNHRFTAILKQKKRYPINQINIISFNIGSLIRKREEVYAAVLRSEYLIEILNFQTSGALMDRKSLRSFSIPGYHCMSNQRDVVSYVFVLESDNKKLIYKQRDITSILSEKKTDKRVIKKMDIISIDVQKIEMLDMCNYAYNHSIIPVNISNIYIRPNTSKILTKYYRDYFLNLSKEVNNKKIKEAIFCGDFNTNGLKFASDNRLPTKSRYVNHNENWIIELMNTQENLYQHVLFSSHNSKNFGSGNFLDLVFTSKKSSIINCFNGGEIRKTGCVSYKHSSVCFVYNEVADKIFFHTDSLAEYKLLKTNTDNQLKFNKKITLEALNKYRLTRVNDFFHHYFYDTYRYERGVDEASFNRICTTCPFKFNNNNNKKNSIEHLQRNKSSHSQNELKTTTFELLNKYNYKLV